MQIEEKLAREAHEQMMYEHEVAKMEAEEMELINRLKNTKMVEEQAQQHLEQAYSKPLAELPQAESTKKAKNKKSFQN